MRNLSIVVASLVIVFLGQKSRDHSARVNVSGYSTLSPWETGDGTTTNAQMTPRTLRRFCKLDGESEKLMENAITRLGLSARAYDRILRVSRTIADLEAVEKIQPKHVAEAIQYRTLDRTNWQQSGRPFPLLAGGDPNNDGNTRNDRAPNIGRNTWCFRSAYCC